MVSENVFDSPTIGQQYLSKASKRESQSKRKPPPLWAIPLLCQSPLAVDQMSGPVQESIDGQLFKILTSFQKINLRAEGAQDERSRGGVVCDGFVLAWRDANGRGDPPY